MHSELNNAHSKQETYPVVFRETCNINFNLQAMLKISPIVYVVVTLTNKIYEINDKEGKIIQFSANKRVIKKHFNPKKEQKHKQIEQKSQRHDEVKALANPEVQYLITLETLEIFKSEALKARYALFFDELRDVEAMREMTGDYSIVYVVAMQANTIYTFSDADKQRIQSISFPEIRRSFIQSFKEKVEIEWKRRNERYKCNRAEALYIELIPEELERFIRNVHRQEDKYAVFFKEIGDSLHSYQDMTQDYSIAYVVVMLTDEIYEVDNIEGTITQFSEMRDLIQDLAAQRSENLKFMEITLAEMNSLKNSCRPQTSHQQLLDGNEHNSELRNPRLKHNQAMQFIISQKWFFIISGGMALLAYIVSILRGEFSNQLSAFSANETALNQSLKERKNSQLSNQSDVLQLSEAGLDRSLEEIQKILKVCYNQSDILQKMTLLFYPNEKLLIQDYIEVDLVKSIQDKELKQNLSIIFNNYNTVIIIADAGYGKTTLNQYNTYQWAEDNLWKEKFELVFLYLFKRMLSIIKIIHKQNSRMELLPFA